MEYGAIFDNILAACDRGEAPYDDALALLPGFLAAEPAPAQAYARALRDRAEAELARAAAAGDAALAERCARFYEESALLMAPHDLDAYMLYMELGREPAKRFYRPRRSVLLPAVVRHLQLLGDGLLDLLAISMPPRTGKSTTGIFFMTWTMGRDPLSANVMSGHSTTLTEGFYKEALSLISDDQTYRFARVFPEAPLVDTSARNLEIALRRKGRFPTLTARSIGATLTGAVEVGRNGVLYVDDVVEDREQALSRQRMDKLYAAYLNQLKDRKLVGAREVHVATRWCPDDVIGRLKALYAGDPRRRFVSVPAVDAAGRSNFVYERGLGFDDTYYADMRRSLEEAGEGDSWRAKYMGEPEYVGGLMFPEADLRRYSDLPAGEPDAVVCACDTKDKGSDFCAMPVGALYGGDVYIIDAVLDDSLPKLYVPRLVDCMLRNGVQRARFESNAAGGVIADQVEAACAEAGRAPKMLKVYSTQNKETRILADSDWIVQNCLFPAEPATRDMARFIAQLTSYTTEGKNPHDDAPDSMSMLKRLVCSMRGARVEAVARIA